MLLLKQILLEIYLPCYTLDPTALHDKKVVCALVATTHTNHKIVLKVAWLIGFGGEALL